MFWRWRIFAARLLTIPSPLMHYIKWLNRNGTKQEKRASGEGFVPVIHIRASDSFGSWTNKRRGCVLNLCVPSHAVQSVAWSLAANVTQCLSSSNLMTCRGEKRKDRLSAAPPISMDFCTIPTIGSDMFLMWFGCCV